MDGQILANNLHNAGLSDSEIAELAGCTREYINKIRSGKKVASESLANMLHYVTENLDRLLEVDTSQSYRQGYSSQRTVSNDVDTPMSLSSKIIIGGVVLFFVAIICSPFIIQWIDERNERKRQERDDTGL